MRGRLVILSDLHLGRARAGARSVEALRPLWRGASHLVINGDVAEVHHPQFRATAARQVLELFDCCEADQVQLTLLSGNHDPYLTDLRHLELREGRVFITHGDALHPAVAPWSPAAAQMRRARRAALERLAPPQRDSLEGQLHATQHAAHAEWEELTDQAAHSSITSMLLRPWAIAQVLHYWSIFPRMAAEFAAMHAPEARFIITGHTHHPGLWRTGERLIINTGSFGFPGSPRAVVVEEHALSFVKIMWRGDRYVLHDQPIATFKLPETAEDEREADEHLSREAGVAAVGSHPGAR